ncbi:hypothetical protein EPO17_03775 [Patescibacteria group bacterium]|nr:MAG: hypothetical protein EPO17_03775 [Patescibacteria group bacterium]
MPTKNPRLEPPGKARSNGQITGNVGLYYCCYQLSLRNWNVMPTARNARGVDIVAYNSDATRIIGIQVKALSKRSAVPLGKSLKNVMGNFWIIVNKVTTGAPTAFILTPAEVIEGAHLAGKGENAAYWMEPGKYDRARFKEAWDRLKIADRA